MDPDLDRLVKYAEMMQGQLKAAKSAHMVTMFYRSGVNLVAHDILDQQYTRLIKIGEDALAPYRSELKPNEKAHSSQVPADVRGSFTA